MIDRYRVNRHLFLIEVIGDGPMQGARGFQVNEKTAALEAAQIAPARPPLSRRAPTVDTSLPNATCPASF